MMCGDVEARVFARDRNASKGRARNGVCSGFADGFASSGDEGGVRVTGDVGERGRVGKSEEGEEERLTTQQLGRRRAEEREKVRQAARRGVVFGFGVGGGEERRRVEAVQGGRVVEASFAKGEWGVRWREGGL